ncbi:MAG: hypothetical protein R6V50_01245 [Thermoplasmatota archaeon]
MIKSGRTITHAFQVTETLSDPSTRKREIEGLRGAMDTLNLNEGTIITLDTEETIKVNTKKIYVVPYWKWLLK